MARPNKIDEYGCSDIVAAGSRMGKSVRQIAKDCSEWAGVEISHTAVQRYISETLPL